MKIEKIGSRGVIFTYDAEECPLGGGYSVYLINGEKNVYLCDTHLGPESMMPIKEYLAANGLAGKPLVIFFSHSDWDHVWGAGAFPGALVVGHDKCAQRLFDRGKLELLRYAQYKRGEIELVYPGLTFDSRLSFPEDGVEFIYAPGHTVDSAICLDRRDAVVFVGDLVEKPEPVISHYDLETYIETLETLLGLAPKLMVSSHSGLVSSEDIENNIQFLQNFQDIALSEPQEDDADNSKEEIRKLYTLLMYEDAILQTAGDSLDYLTFQREFWRSLDLDYLNPESVLLQSLSAEDLKLALESYLIEL